MTSYTIGRPCHASRKRRRQSSWATSSTVRRKRTQMTFQGGSRFVFLESQIFRPWVQNRDLEICTPRLTASCGWEVFAPLSFWSWYLFWGVRVIVFFFLLLFSNYIFGGHLASPNPSIFKILGVIVLFVYSLEGLGWGGASRAPAHPTHSFFGLVLSTFLFVFLFGGGCTRVKWVPFVLLAFSPVL